MTETERIQAKFQALRLQRFYLAQLNYLISYSVILVAWLVDQYDAGLSMALTHIVLGVTLQGSIFLMLKSGFNLRFKDPSLTSLQIIIAMLLLTHLLAFAGNFRGSLIMIYPIILMFGIFHLSRRAFLAHGGLALVCYGSLIIYNMYFSENTQELSVQLLEWFVLGSFMAWLSLFGSYIRELRERLQKRHNTLQLHQETLKGMMSQLQELAATDSLTGLANRRHFIREAERQMALLGPGQRLGLALIDLDHFKRINDLYGHGAGDEVLLGFARLAREKLRENDLIARFGGEEFILLLANSDLASLRQCLERIRTGFSEIAFPGLPQGVYCTLSAGLALIHPGDDLELRIHEADQALYRAKHSGRNRCETHQKAYA